MCPAREKMWDIQLPSWRTRQKRTAPKRWAAHTAAYLSTTARQNIREIMKPFEACKPKDQTPPSVSQTSWGDSHAKLKPESHMNSHEAMLECWQYSKERLGVRSGSLKHFVIFFMTSSTDLAMIGFTFLQFKLHCFMHLVFVDTVS